MAALVDIAAFSVRVSEKTVWTFVRARDAEGRTGWGEATLQGKAGELHRHVDAFAPIVVAHAASPYAETADLVGTQGRSAAESAAIGGIDQALCDLQAQAKRVPLAFALGSPLRSTVALYANVNRGTLDRSPVGFAARARDAVVDGFGAVKIAPFDDVRAESIDTAEGRQLFDVAIERIAAVRMSIGPQVALLVDCHWRLNESAASSLLREIEPLSLYWLECPLPENAEALSALRRLRAQANRSGVRLAGCETMTGVEGFRPFVEAGAYDVIMPDVKYAGGLVEMQRIAESAAASGLQCSPHNPSGPIAHAHSVHSSALLTAFPFLEFQYAESALFFDIVTGAFPDPRTGSCIVPDVPGAGAGIDLERVQPLLVTNRR